MTEAVELIIGFHKIGIEQTCPFTNFLQISRNYVVSLPKISYPESFRVPDNFNQIIHGVEIDHLMNFFELLSKLVKLSSAPFYWPSLQ